MATLGEFEEAVIHVNRERLGQVVREAWVAFCREIGDDKPSHVAPWEELSEQDREVDRRIGEAVVREWRSWFTGG